MLKIKLTRLGKKSEPRYRIVVNQARCRRDGEYVAQLGIYQPTMSPKVLQLDLKAYGQWLKKGAQPTPTVAFLAKVVEEGKGFPQKKPTLSKKAQAKLKAAQEKAAEEKQATADKDKAVPVEQTATPATNTPEKQEESAKKEVTKQDAAPAEVSKKD